MIYSLLNTEVNMPRGVYFRTDQIKKNISASMKGKIPHNKGKESQQKLRKIEKFQLGLPILCKIHGEHTRWRIHSLNNVQCKECALVWARKQKKTEPLRFIFRDAKRHAKTSNRDFNITIDDLHMIYSHQNGKCALTGIFFDEDNLPSLDRKDSYLGYVKENVQLVLISINRMKSDLDEKKFIELCKKITDFREKNR